MRPSAKAEPPPPHIRIENLIALEGNGLRAGVMSLGKVSSYTCPDCHGVLVQIEEGKVVRFRCHTGHAFSFKALLTEVNQAIDKGLWDTLRAIEERILLLRQMADVAGPTRRPPGSRRGAQVDATAAELHVKTLHDLVLDGQLFGSRTGQISPAARGGGALRSTVPSGMALGALPEMRGDERRDISAAASAELGGLDGTRRRWLLWKLAATSAVLLLTVRRGSRTEHRGARSRRPGDRAHARPRSRRGRPAEQAADRGAQRLPRRLPLLQRRHEGPDGGAPLLRRSSTRT